MLQLVIAIIATTSVLTAANYAAKDPLSTHYGDPLITISPIEKVPTEINKNYLPEIITPLETKPYPPKGLPLPPATVSTSAPTLSVSFNGSSYEYIIPKIVSTPKPSAESKPYPPKVTPILDIATTSPVVEASSYEYNVSKIIQTSEKPIKVYPTAESKPYPHKTVVSTSKPYPPKPYPPKVIPSVSTNKPYPPKVALSLEDPQPVSLEKASNNEYSSKPYPPAESKPYPPKVPSVSYEELAAPAPIAPIIPIETKYEHSISEITIVSSTPYPSATKSEPQPSSSAFPVPDIDIRFKQDEEKIEVPVEFSYEYTIPKVISTAIPEISYPSSTLHPSTAEFGHYPPKSTVTVPEINNKTSDAYNYEYTIPKVIQHEVIPSIRHPSSQPEIHPPELAIPSLPAAVYGVPSASPPSAGGIGAVIETSYEYIIPKVSSTASPSPISAQSTNTHTVLSEAEAEVHLSQHDAHVTAEYSAGAGFVQTSDPTATPYKQNVTIVPVVVEVPSARPVVTVQETSYEYTIPKNPAVNVTVAIPPVPHSVYGVPAN